MRVTVVFLLCSALISQVFAQVLHFGTCPQVKTVTLFDIERFLGTWHVIERFPAWFEDKGSCARKLIQACGRRIEIQHVFVKDDIEYFLHMNSTYNPGDEAVFEVEPNSIDPVGIPLSVISTDYDNYAIIYGCKVNELLNIKYALAWILSRDVTLDPDLLQEAIRILTAIPSSSASYLEHVEQDRHKCSHHWTAHIHAVNTADEGD